MDGDAEPGEMLAQARQIIERLHFPAHASQARYRGFMQDDVVVMGAAAIQMFTVERLTRRLQAEHVLIVPIGARAIGDVQRDIA